jgi:ribonuclease HII
VDEVGRGAWAGPVTVCAVIVRSGFPAPPGGLTDSKRLGPTPHHRLSWSYLDDLPRWRHLKRPRPDVEGQLSLL